MRYQSNQDLCARKEEKLIMSTIFITGSSRGIGYETAKYFGQRGWNIAINAHHNREALQKAKESLEKEGISVLSLPGDVGDFHFWEESMQKILDTFGEITCVVNNAAISHVGLLSYMSVEEWSNLINQNLNSVFYSAKTAVPAMLKKHSGCLIQITSVWGEVGASCEVAYSASKGGVIAFTKALAKELAPSHIRVNALSLGMFDTSMNDCFSDEEKQMVIDEIPADRMGDPIEAADMIYKLATAPDYLTGQIIRLDGGWI